MPSAADRPLDRCLSLTGLRGPVAFDAGTAPIADGLRAVLGSWPEDKADSSAAPSLLVRRRRDAISVTRSRDGWRALESSEVSAISTAVVEIVAEYVAEQDGLGSLHAAAAEFKGQLVVFPAVHRAGKSTLMAALSAAGHRVFADDLLPVDLTTLEGIATGCLPRLRLPLPDDVTPSLKAFVTAHTTLSDGRYAYVADTRAVGHGERAPIGAVVLLDRHTEPCPAALNRAEPDEALLGLMIQDARNVFPVGQTLERYHSLISQARLYRLSYFKLADAVQCLEAAFLHWPAPAASSPEPTDTVAVRAGATPMRAALDRPGRYRRSPVGILKRVGNSAFVVDPGRNDVHYLNAIALGLWNVLEEPQDEEPIIEIFLGAFPDEPENLVRDDVSTALRRLVEVGLIEDRQTECRAPRPG